GIVERALTQPYLMGNSTMKDVVARATPLFADRYAAAGLDITNRQDFVKPIGAYLAHIEPDGADADRFFDGNVRAISDIALRGANLFETYGCTACHQGRGVGGNMTARFGVMVSDPYAERHKCDD